MGFISDSITKILLPSYCDGVISQGIEKAFTMYGQHRDEKKLNTLVKEHLQRYIESCKDSLPPEEEFDTQGLLQARQEIISSAKKCVTGVDREHYIQQYFLLGYAKAGIDSNRRNRTLDAILATILNLVQDESNDPVTLADVDRIYDGLFLLNKKAEELDEKLTEIHKYILPKTIRNYQKFYDFANRIVEEDSSLILGEMPLKDGYIEPYISTESFEKISVHDFIENWIEKDVDGGILVLFSEPGHGISSLCWKAMYDFGRGWLSEKVDNVFRFSLDPLKVEDISNLNANNIRIEKFFTWGETRSNKVEKSDCNKSLIFLDGFDKLADYIPEYTISQFLTEQVKPLIDEEGDIDTIYVVITSSKMRIITELEITTSNKKNDPRNPTSVERYVFQDRKLRKTTAVYEILPIESEEQDNWINAYKGFLRDKIDNNEYQEFEKYLSKFDSIRKKVYLEKPINNFQFIFERPIFFRMLVANRYWDKDFKITDFFRNLFALTMELHRPHLRLINKEKVHKHFEDLAFCIYENDMVSVKKTNLHYSKETWDPWICTLSEDASKEDVISFSASVLYNYFLASGIIRKLMNSDNKKVLRKTLAAFAKRRIDDTTFDYMDELSSLMKGREKDLLKVASDNIYEVLSETDGILSEALIISECSEKVSFYQRSNNIFWNCICICSVIGYPIRKAQWSEERDWKKQLECLKDYDMRSCRLKNAKLPNYNLCTADLRRADLSTVDLRNADIRGANLISTVLRSADLREADLRYAGLQLADLWDANLNEARLWGANLSHADLSEVKMCVAELRWANLQSACLENAILEETDFSKANLRSSYLQKAKLWYADFEKADLRKADFREADLTNADLREADLRWADLRKTKLSNANLGHADLRHADLRHAKIEDAVFWKTDLSLADLRYVEGLESVDFSTAKLVGAKFLKKDLEKVENAESVFIGCIVEDEDEAVIDAGR